MFSSNGKKEYKYLGPEYKPFVKQFKDFFQTNE